MKSFLTLSICLLAAACGDNLTGTNNPGPDAGPNPDTAPDASTFTPPTPFAVSLSAAGPDQLQSAVAGPNGSFYAVGFAAATLTGAKDIVVVKLAADGTLDTAFGDGDGIASTGVAFRGGTDDLDIVRLPDGKLVVSGTVAAATPNPLDASDTDVAVLRLDADGELDATFGGGDGVLVVNLNTSVLDTQTPPAAVGRDASRGLAVDGDGKIYLHAVQRGEGLDGGLPRTDTDFAVVRILADGSNVDSAYGTANSGKHLLDIQRSNATTHGIHVLADGSVIGNGYANSSGIGTVQPVLYKLTPAGALDPSFATGGLFHETVLSVQTEIYNVAIHDDAIVTAGYGRDTGAQNDWVSLRFDLATGARDLTWGGTTNGAVVIDVSGAMIGDNCRNAIALPGGKTALVGSTGPGNMPEQDAAFAILDATGKLDTTFGSGVHTFKLGADGNDQFWGGVVSGAQVLFVGYKGGGATQTETTNDDSFGALLSLE